VCCVFADQAFHDVQRAVDARGDAGRRDDLAAVYEPLTFDNSTGWRRGLQVVDGPVVRRRFDVVEQPNVGEQQRAVTDRHRDLGVAARPL
jgi:hypothetical protein